MQHYERFEFLKYTSFVHLRFKRKNNIKIIQLEKSFILMKFLKQFQIYALFIGTFS